jgi:hypothetical protein
MTEGTDGSRPAIKVDMSVQFLHEALQGLASLLR